MPGILEQLLRNLAQTVYHNLGEVLQAEMEGVDLPPYPSAASPRARRTPPLGRTPGDRRQPRPGQAKPKKPPVSAPPPPPPPHIPGFSALDTAYAVLGVGTEAGRQEVRGRYMALVKETAVDRGGSPTRAALVNAAYQAVCQARGWKK